MDYEREVQFNRQGQLREARMEASIKEMQQELVSFSPTQVTVPALTSSCSDEIRSC